MNKLEKIKILCTKIKNNNANVKEKIEYYELLISIANNKTEGGRKIIINSKKAIKEILEEVKKQNNKFIEISFNKEKIYHKQFKNKVLEINKLNIKRGDKITLIFNDNSKSMGTVKNIRFGFYYENKSYHNKNKILKMYIDYIKEDGYIYESDIMNISKLKIDSVGRGKKNLLENNKTLESYLKYN